MQAFEYIKQELLLFTYTEASCKEPKTPLHQQHDIVYRQKPLYWPGKKKGKN